MLTVIDQTCKVTNFSEICRASASPEAVARKHAKGRRNELLAYASMRLAPNMQLFQGHAAEIVSQLPGELTRT